MTTYGVMTTYVRTESDQETEAVQAWMQQQPAKTEVKLYRASWTGEKVMVYAVLWRKCKGLGGYWQHDNGKTFNRSSDYELAHEQRRTKADALRFLQQRAEHDLAIAEDVVTDQRALLAALATLQAPPG